MRKIFDYKVIDSETPKELEKNVKPYIENGYKPLSGVVIQKIGDKCYKLVQTLIKEDGEYLMLSALDNMNENLKDISGALKDIDARINQAG